MIPTEHMPQVIIKQDCKRCVLSFLQEVTCTVLFAVYLSLLFLFCSLYLFPQFCWFFALHIL